MRSEADTVEAYLAGLSPDQRDLVERLRTLVHRHLPDGWEERMAWGMISYDIPMEQSGPTYNGKPLMFAAIGAQKRHVGLYLCGLYCRPERREAFAAGWARTGTKLDMGAACLRLRQLNPEQETLIAQALSAVTVPEFIEAQRR